MRTIGLTFTPLVVYLHTKKKISENNTKECENNTKGYDNIVQGCLKSNANFCDSKGDFMMCIHVYPTRAKIAFSSSLVIVWFKINFTLFKARSHKCDNIMIFFFFFFLKVL